MGLIETMVESVSGGEGATHAQLAQAINGLFGADGSGGVGLHGLVQRLEAAGQGDIVASWIGKGPNLPIAPTVLHAALGDTAVRRMAGHAHLEPDAFIARLSEHLPAVVDRLTPNGILPIG